MPYDTEMSQRHAAWAIKEWWKLPARTRAMLLPCIKAADEGFAEVQKHWLRFTARFDSLKNWEAAALGDVVRYLVKNASPEDRANIFNDYHTFTVPPCPERTHVHVVDRFGMAYSGIAADIQWYDVVYWEKSPGPLTERAA
jgi:hypothetical protein